MSLEIRDLIGNGHATLGIELGSTRIKAVLITPDHDVVATGSYQWENKLVDGYWSYDLAEIHSGVQAAYASLADDVRSRWMVTPHTFAAIGISAMMHGYLAFGEDGALLTPFRTWRNTTTAVASAALSDALAFTVPQRWSAAHLYQAVLDEEPHIPSVARVTTLAGYVHYLLTGRFVLGVGDASGMFPIDSATCDYDQSRVEIFDSLLAQHGFTRGLRDVFPAVLPAGADAGALSVEGAAFLDPSGALQAGVRMAPPEGDAGTGMVATNAVAPRTGNISAGTSVFAMLVLEQPLKQHRMEVDPVTTPAGAQVAMVHSNNGASELDAWTGMFIQFAQLAGMDMSAGDVYELLYRHALEGEASGGGVTSFNFLSGEPVIGLESGRPLVVRSPESHLTLATMMRTQLMSVFAPIRVGMNLLAAEEGISVDRLFAHGGIFTTKGVAQKVLADALNVEVAVGETASEGGAWGIAVLAQYCVAGNGLSLPDYLDQKVFAGADVSVMAPDTADAAAFDEYLERYMALLPAAQAAADASTTTAAI